MLLILYSITLYHHSHRPTVQPHFTIASQLFHHTLLSLRHCFTVPPHFIITGSLFHCFITLYYHCATVPPHLPSLRHCFTVPLPFTTTAPLFFHTLLPPHHCSTTLYHPSTTVPLFSCFWFTRRVWLCDSPVKTTSSCIWVVIPVDWKWGHSS